MDEAETRRRVLAALRGLAVGDAMGAATEGYLSDEILDVYEAPINELIEPVNLYPESAPDRERGTVGAVTEGALAALDALETGNRATVAGLGWAATLGLVTPASALDRLIADAATLGVEIAPGVAVAAAVGAGAGGYMARDAIALAVRGAQLAGDPDLAGRIIAAAGAGQESGGRQVGMIVAETFPPGPGDADAVVFAFGVAFGTQSVRRAIPQAVNQGGAASLTAGLAGALCGSFAPGSSVEAWAAEVEAASRLDLARVAERVLALRRARSASA